MKSYKYVVKTTNLDNVWVSEQIIENVDVLAEFECINYKIF